jgi:hypothetical protein
MSDAVPEQARPDSDDRDAVFRLMYRSRIRIPVQTRKQQLGEIFSIARSNNKRLDVTGALLLSDHWFVQVLEGAEDAVRGLYAAIEADPRHDSVTLVETTPEDRRIFGRWAMAKVAAAEHEPDIPLIAHTDGIHAAAGRRTTPEQDQLLDRMRGVARGAAQPV